MKKSKENQTEISLYHISIAILAVVGLAVFIITLFPDTFANNIFRVPCPVKTFTGIYCPGCGGTRAAHYFFTGHPLKSFLSHPLVPYSIILFAGFMISHTIRAISKGRVKGMKFRNSYVYMAVAIIVLNFIIKNYLLLTTGIDILANI